MRGREEVRCQISLPWSAYFTGVSLSEIESVKLSLRESSRTERTNERKPKRLREEKKNKRAITVGWKDRGKHHINMHPRSKPPKPASSCPCNR